jgi:ATP-dependent Clp protease ATP-binding subunit ClpB
MNSVPEPIDVLNSRIRNLEIEKEAVKREGSSIKSEKIETELSQCKAERDALMARWDKEKGIVTELNNLRQEIEDLKRDAMIAERSGDYGKVAEIRYGKLADAQKRLAELSEQQAAITDPIITEAVTAEDIAEVVGSSVEAVRVACSRARQKVKEQLIKFMNYGV